MALEGVPSCDKIGAGREVRGAFTAAATQLRDGLQACVLELLGLLRGPTDIERLFGDPSARRASSERTRRGAWMFALVTRAFVAKARALPDRGNDGWEAPSAHEFLQDFARYFKAIGQHLAIETEYPESERLIHTLESLRDADYVSSAGLATAVTECEAFMSHLLLVIDRVGRRDDSRV